MTHLTAEMRFWHKTKPTIHSAQIKGREGGSELSVSLLLVTAEVATNSLGPRNQHRQSQAQTLTNNLETELPKHKFSSANLKRFIEPMSEPQPPAISEKASEDFGFNSQLQQPQEAICACYFPHQAHVPLYIPRHSLQWQPWSCVPSPVCLLSCPTPLLWGSAYANHMAFYP